MVLICLVIAYNAETGIPKVVFYINGNVTIYSSTKSGTPICKAIIALQRDLEKVLGGNGKVEPLSEMNGSGIVIFISKEDKLIAPSLSGTIINIE